MRPHRREGEESPSAETPGAADTGAGEPRGAEAAGSTRPECVCVCVRERERSKNPQCTNDKCKAASTKSSALKCRVDHFYAAPQFLL